MMDQNLVAVQWGLLSVFGVVLTLLIPHANRLRRIYLRTGTRPAYRLALGWAWRIMRTAVLVLLGLAALSLVGACDAGLVAYVPPESAITSGKRWWIFVVDREFPRVGLATWLLLAPIVAQGVFLVLVVFGLVRWVPRLKTLRLEPADDVRPSILGTPRRTVIHFVNEAPTAVCLHWIDSTGALQTYPPIPAGGPDRPPGQGRSQQTFENHRWRLTRQDGWVHTVTAVRNPGEVVIR